MAEQDAGVQARYRVEGEEGVGGHEVDKGLEGKRYKRESQQL